ncbi:septum formation family protein [Georgenia muralis]|uniref:Putative regulator of septum formation n=1 Tax=Georgenia muralis TaxID=154117 RepID=A0A3N4ZB28_9MICO|nr:septum formation family protein [Georgenia muralis]RPF28440.1 putative regulator of septum formation [Georgenia muralis]
MKRAASIVLPLLLLVGLTGCGPTAVRDDTGAVATAGTVDAFSVALGDCVSEGGAEASEEVVEVSQVEVVPCAESHDSEVYAVFDLADGEFPGDEAVMGSADEGCYGAFAEFVGAAYEDSTLDFGTYFPTEESWNGFDDREVVCLLVDPAGAVTGTLKGAAR